VGIASKDLGSSNETQINGVCITDAELKDGAEIRFGYVTGVFQDATASIDQARELQIQREHDRPARIRLSETQSILRPRTQ
jgi:pSer/pThr/pTyr-binding forkhead associated (FHA) protein